MTATPPHGTDAEEFALLGEPFAVELANTRYVDNGVVHDLIATPERFDDWMAHAGDGVGTRIDVSGFSDVSTLRDATHELIAASADGMSLPPAPLDVVDAALARSPLSVHLDRTERGLSVGYEGVDDSVDAVLAVLALHTAEFLARIDAGIVVRRCARRGCPLLFVPEHRRRRFCHPRCSNAERQRRHREHR